ncbi:MAG: hypothetical protein DCF31_10580 [Alphaproteobacteria bacterium]|nr:MAG: hypothetical protein DCF31_10580 [Alphaproteobacteria bacterium]
MGRRNWRLRTALATGLAVGLAALHAAAAVAQDSPYGTSDYGGGWASPSLDTSMAISREVINRSIIDDIARKHVAGSSRPTTPAPKSASGSSPSHDRAAAGFRTDFVRSKVVQRRSEARLLAELAQRQPNAVAEYRQVLAGNDMAAIFDRSAAAYGLKSNDVADTMAAYWLVSWVIANDAADFTVAQARAVRGQLRAGLARSAAARFDAPKKQQMADEAIFNTLVATAIYESVQNGKISKADYRRVGEVTYKTFLGTGADLRQLRLTDAGFVKR